MKHEEHKQKTVSALKWNTLNQIINQGITFVIGIVLMRLLSPDDYGLLGMVMVITGFMAIFSNFGLVTSLIQKKEIDELDKSSVFYTNVAIGSLLGLLLFAGSGLIATFYKIPELKIISRVVSVTFLTSSLGMVHYALLKKNLEFKKLFIILTFISVLGGVSALILAYYNFGVWALVYRLLIGSFLSLILAWVMVDWRPKWLFSFQTIKSHLKFSLPLLGTNTLNYWSRNVDNLLIGKFLGSVPLGLYSRAYGLMMLPLNQISGVISSVMMPSFSLIQEDKERIKAIYLKISRVIAFITFPMMGFLFVAAKPLVAFAFGDKWMGIVFLLKVFAFVGALQSIVTLNGNIYISQGRTDIQFKLKIFTTIVVIIAFLIGVQYGVNGVAVSYLIAFIINIIPGQYIMGNIINLSIADFFLNIRSQTIILAVLTLSGMLIIGFVSNYANYVQVLIIGFLFGSGWIGLLKLFDQRLISELLKILADVRRKK